MAQWHCLWLVKRCLLPTLLTTLLLVNLTLLLPRTRTPTPQPISMGKNATMKYISPPPPPQPPLANKSPPSPQPLVQLSLATKRPPQLSLATKSPPPSQSSFARKPPPSSPQQPSLATKLPPPPPPPPQSSLATKPPPPPPQQTVKRDAEEEFYQTKRRIAGRVARLREKCSKMDKPSKVKTKTLDISLASRIQVLEEHRLMACQVQKAGSTAWNTLLAFRYNSTKILNKKDYYKMLFYLNPTVKRFKEVATSKDFRRFLIVRDPLERLLSAYRDKFWDQSTVSWQASYYVPLILRYNRGQSYTHQEIYFINGSVRIVPTFTEFVRFVVDEPLEEFDTHWKPISLYCGVCYINYTDIVHMDTYLPDMNYILRVSGLDQVVDPGLLTYNAHKGRANTQDLLFSYYSELGSQLLQKVVDVYKKEYSLFGYDPTDFLAKVSPNVTIRWRV